VDKKTSLYDEHVKLGARMVAFAGWVMPIQYKGIREEHSAVRNHVGLFDVSHMGEVFVRGPKSLETLQWLTTNDVSKLEKGQAHYSLLPNPQGGLVDDIIVYCIEPGKEYLVCVNAANTDKDFQWMLKNNKGADITNESDKWSQIAIQGPNAMKLVDKILGDVSSLKSFTFAPYSFDGAQVLVARTGYTGEDGVEVFIPNAKAPLFWNRLMTEGRDLGVEAIGLGARDTLRTEMKYSLYGHEITDETDPISAGLGWVVKLDKGDFIGREVMAKIKADGPRQKLIGFKLIDKGIPREGYGLFSFDLKETGKVTSGTLSPSLNEGIGIGYVGAGVAAVGTEIFVDIRGRKAKAKIVKTPFVATKGV
jgi:aminomethyltransferase